MKRVNLPYVFLLLFAAPRCSSIPPPHIIFILADDLGWNDVGFHGMTEIPTPNIDALAGDGLILNNYYVCPLCTPSRASLMTGYYPSHTGFQHLVIRNGQSTGLPLHFRTLPNRLTSLGYKNHIIGKWHLGFHQKEYTPLDRGFHGHFGPWGSHIDYNDHKCLVYFNRSEMIGLPENYTQERVFFVGVDLRENMDHATKYSGKYLTDLLTRKSIELIESHNTSQPLFLYVSHHSVHRANYLRNITSVKKYTKHFEYIADDNRKQFAGHLSSLDRSVGQIIKALYQKNMLSNSVVIFSSDNGADVTSRTRNFGSNWPLRGQKFSQFEGGVRAPAFIWSPLLRRSRGVSNQMMHITDWLPTLYSAAGGRVQDLGDVDGIDMWQALKNYSSPSPRKEMLLVLDSVWNISALRYGRYKLVVSTSSSVPFDVREKVTRREILPNISCRKHAVVPDVLWNFYIHHGGKAAEFTPNIQVNCGKTETETPCSPGKEICLFDLEKDPCEYNDISWQEKEVLSILMKKLEKYKSTSVPPLHKGIDFAADPARFDGRWSPWIQSSS